MNEKVILLRRETMAMGLPNCQKCPLHSTAKKVVQGRGNFSLSMMLIGEAPGEKEDSTGLPFVGKAGHKLSECLRKAGIVESDVFISNIVKHRPPDNRKPELQEVGVCSQFLLKEIEMLEPEVIVTLGSTSTEFFLPKVKITAARGKPMK